jgi:hypothetical protein
MSEDLLGITHYRSKRCYESHAMEQKTGVSPLAWSYFNGRLPEMNSRSGRPAELPEEPAMRSLRVKFTILGLMLAVAVVALLLTLAVRMHPQPVFVWILVPEGGTIESAAASGPSRIPHSAPGYEILWSDGSKTKLGYDAPIPRCHGEPFAFGFLRRVEWFVGTPPTRTSYTWHTSWPSEPIPKPPPG